MVKNFKSTNAVIMTSHTKQRNITIQLLFKTSCLIVMKVCIRLLDATRPMVKKFKSTHVVIMTSHLKQRNITIQLLFQNYLLDSNESLYTSVRRPQDLW